jgi:hypothetical protein
LRPEPLPDGFNFCDGETGESTVTFIAPESTVSANPIPISQTDLTKVQEGTLHLYFWGWAAYRDVFRDSKVHLTEFCSKLTTISGDIATGNVRFVYTHCPSHNCADETCEDYREVEQRLTNLSEQKSCG